MAQCTSLYKQLKVKIKIVKLGNTKQFARKSRVVNIGPSPPKVNI